MKIEANRDICIGAGNCVLAAEDVFDQDDDAIVEVLEDHPSPDQETEVRNAVAQCPSGALSLVDD
ncbi:ferredoxin [Actinomycetospora sp. NBRC 106375]|uniref:ferredoxin n=1 Tax=Actinomycetospora sp. NBRC 106375 TaxID=3032207 RepID=UPI0024A051CF|nr:(4Fe-4S)-binding protein [Actinomycetospora sp. NBRC 106375]GLZ47250.1 ferredoxin [Actinomycetospora sp. NBRC 106375]